MAETNQELIMSQGGIGLLARTADDAEDPQTLRMVAGAIANLCGNGTSSLILICKCFNSIFRSPLQPDTSAVIESQTFLAFHNVILSIFVL